MHVQKALIRTIKGNTPLGHGHHGIVLAQVRRQDHDTGIEEVGPSDIRSGGEGVWDREQLVGSTVSDDIGVKVDNLGELHQSPEVDLGEGRV
jgi:hypothetical protein